MIWIFVVAYKFLVLLILTTYYSSSGFICAIFHTIFNIDILLNKEMKPNLAENSYVWCRFL